VPTEWETVPLGDVVTLDVERVVVQPDDEYRLVGVLIAGQGLFWRDTIRGSETNYPALHRLRTGQLVMRKLTAWEGPITTVPPPFDGGYVSSEFPTFTLDESRLLPEYMRLICQRPSFHAEMRLRSTGTAERRNRLKPEDLLSIDVELPSLDEQRAIVAVAAAAEDLDLALGDEEAATTALIRAAHRQVLGSIADEPVRIADVTNVVSGGTPSRDHPEYFGGDVFWVKSGDIVFRDIHDAPETITKDAIAHSAAKLLPSKAVVVAMYGQGATRGRSAVLQAPMTTNQACAAILPTEALSERYLFHWLWSQYEGLRDSSEGTTQPNLSKRVIENLKIPLPHIDRQREIAAYCDAILDRLVAVEEERHRASAIRPALVGSMLSGDRRVRVVERTAA
jgi:type I restriction enzyme, S subunit